MLVSVKSVSGHSHEAIVTIGNYTYCSYGRSPWSALMKGIWMCFWRGHAL